MGESVLTVFEGLRVLTLLVFVGILPIANETPAYGGVRQKTEKGGNLCKKRLL
jgi:hypothetical protein